MGKKMKLVKSSEEVRTLVKEWKKQGKTVGFVPTMGFLHEGHQSLMQCAKKSCDKVVVSIFVNPMQFGKNEDLAKYPRNIEADEWLCKETGVDLIFHPTVSEIYPNGYCSYVDMDGLTGELCGKSRPGHFRGVCTVVNKLFNIVTPDKAFFGEKDAQQLAVIKRMTTDLNMGIEIVGCPIIREEDGLAKSSRNTYLNEKERKAALVLYRTILMGKELVKSGTTDARVLVREMKKNIRKEKLAKIDYIEAVSLDTIMPVEVIKGNVLVAMAVYIGNTRLIDNFRIEG